MRIAQHWTTAVDTCDCLEPNVARTSAALPKNPHALRRNEKTRQATLGHNFGKRKPILKFLPWHVVIWDTVRITSNKITKPEKVNNKIT